MIRELTQSLDIISALENEPNDEGGLSAAELKAKFDESGNTIKDYINETLIPDVSDMISEEISASEKASGNVPRGGGAGQLLVKNSEEDYDLAFADMPASTDKLTTARTIGTNLASTEAAEFDGSEDILTGVTGVLQTQNGGTGASTAEDAALALGRGTGTCATAAATAAKAVTLTGFVRIKGAVAGVTFTYANTAASPTLNINDAGAAAIIDSITGSAATAYSMRGRTHFFQFDGTNWILLNPTELKYVSGAATASAGAAGNITFTANLGIAPKAVVLHVHGFYPHFTVTFSALTNDVTQSAWHSANNNAKISITPSSTGFSCQAYVTAAGTFTLRYIAFA